MAPSVGTHLPTRKEMIALEMLAQTNRNLNV
jgi:hypothetical protein